MLLVVHRFLGSSHTVRSFETAILQALGFHSLPVVPDAVVRHGVRRWLSIRTPADHPLNFWAHRFFLSSSRILLSTCTSPARISTILH